MKFLVVTHVRHTMNSNGYFAYAPYVREMNLWFKHMDEVVVAAPLEKDEISAIDLPYDHPAIRFIPIPAFEFTSLQSAFQAIWKIPMVVWRIFQAMLQADHIHLRCPGNVGLLGCFVQVLFPGKVKTAKYAGNWDPSSRQPWSYRLQQVILRNTFLTRNMQVLVYGNWPDRTSNILPFFTASYSAKEIEEVPRRKLGSDQPVRLIFVGTLVPGKRPLLVMQAANLLHRRGVNIQLDMYGEGQVRPKLEAYIRENALENYVRLHGNVDPETVKAAYQNSHFLVFASRSEGWPKAVAEAMFWGCVPVTTAVSCVPEMVGYGERGLLIRPYAEEIANTIQDCITPPSDYCNKARHAMKWSRQFTLERFEKEIVKLVKGDE